MNSTPRFTAPGTSERDRLGKGQVQRSPDQTRREGLRRRPGPSSRRTDARTRPEETQGPAGWRRGGRDPSQASPSRGQPRTDGESGRGQGRFLLGASRAPSTPPCLDFSAPELCGQPRAWPSRWRPPEARTGVGGLAGSETEAQAAGRSPQGHKIQAGTTALRLAFRGPATQHPL